MAFQIKQLGKLLDMGSQMIKEDGVLGIDIGTSSLKVVELTVGKTGAALKTYGELQLGPYGNTDIGKAVNLGEQKLTEALVDILREANVGSHTSALAIPHSASFVVVTKFPTNDHTQLASMVPIEARKYIPMAMNEISLDWFVIPEAAPKAGAAPHTDTRVLLAAIYNESLKRYRSVVQNAGIAVSINEIESFSVIRSSIHEDDALVMVVDLGASSTKMYIVDRGILHETHRMPIGGQDLTNVLASTLKIQITEAEEAKRQFGLLSNEYDVRISDAMRGSVERVVAEARRVLDRYEKDYGVPVQKVILAGGGALLRGLQGEFEKVFERDTLIANPFTKVEYPAFLEETLKEAGPSFAVALGIALRRLTEK